MILILFSRKVYIIKVKTVPQTDTGEWVEHTKALERIIVKELGKLTLQLRDKEGLLKKRWHKIGGSDCLTKTQDSAKSQDDVQGLTPARCQTSNKKSNMLLMDLFGKRRLQL
eukprot:TRINITY_DN12256_c1_g2_i2.p5 TRINITY_DN12256_c1_g2~~TRINITY_DN12256_c1_g2_i2.p5  ORF type:complete len:112 (-),score=8.65 TRINITY_DN12256_c1_g2_i2:44-379(-)